MTCPCFTTMVYLVVIPSIYFLIKFLLDKWKAVRLDKMLARWSRERTPKNVVIVHGFPPGKVCPSPSPFVIKVQTYLRMAGIAYEMDTTDMWGPKGKVPWISVNGEHMADSQLIVEFLAKKFEKNFSKNIDKESLAVGTLCRIVLEEHVLWGLSLERFVFGGRHHIDKTVKLPLPSLLIPYYGRVIQSNSRCQGIGLHSESEIVHLIKKDLRAISTMLGTKKYMCGDEPCEEDAGIFGILAILVWATPESPYEELVTGELKNLERYCVRMKEKFWPDWEQHLLK